jgi:hypothetical protein
VTNFWEHLFTGKSQAESGEAEARQAMNLARAASKTSTLEHYIWSTLPNAKKLSNGKTPCAHLDYKAEVDDKIRSELPELAKKTTFLFFGYYPSNMVFFPMVKPFELVSPRPLLNSHEETDWWISPAATANTSKSCPQTPTPPSSSQAT